MYAALVGGYLAGGMGVAKAVTKYQEYRDKDLEYTRPFPTPFTGLKKVREFLDGEEEDLEDFEVEGEFFDDQEK
ncbi:MAG: hypothetical protein ABEJ87_02740 [Candidatus Nanohalobium sp.]